MNILPIFVDTDNIPKNPEKVEVLNVDQWLSCPDGSMIQS
jgi:hypothetical protein